MEKEVTLKEVLLSVYAWLKFAYKKWVLIAILCSIGVLSGLFYAMTDKPEYTAEITFVLEEGSVGGGISQLGSLAGLVGMDGGSGGIFQGDNILQLYRSKRMIEQTLLTKGSDGVLLLERYLDIKGVRSGWDKTPELLSIDFLKGAGIRSRDSVLTKVIDDILLNNLVIGRPDKKLGIISVKVKSQNERFAKEFVEQLVENVNRFYIDTKTKKSAQTLKILQYQTDSVRAVLSGAIFSSASGLDATPNINASRQVLRAPVQRSQLQIEANNVILTELVKNLELTKMSLRKETPLIQVIDKPTFPLKVEKARILTSTLYGLIFSILISIFVLIGYFVFTDLFKNFQ